MITEYFNLTICPSPHIKTNLKNIKVFMENPQVGSVPTVVYTRNNIYT